MKFSKTLASHLTPEWRTQYIDYQGLKEILYSALVAMNTRGTEATVAAIENEFFESCSENLDKINRFFLVKLSECNRRHASLKSFLNAYKRRNAISMQNKPLSKRKKEALKSDFLEQYLILTLLNNYQTLNLTGFKKIVKKHDKIFENINGKAWFDKWVKNSELAVNNEVTTLMEDTELIVANEFFDGDKSQAMKRLRIPPLHSTTQPSYFFLSGLFIGISIVLLMAGYLGPTIEPKSDFEVHIRLFSPLSYIIIYLCLLAVNVFGWRRSGVNHVLIFELDPRNYLSFIEILQIASFISVIFTLHLVAFVYHRNLNAPRYVFPLLMNLVALLFLINPFPIWFRTTRYWVLISLGRIFATPFFFVKFSDFWIADQLCTLNDVFSGIVYTICFYSCLDDWSSMHPPDTCITVGHLFWLHIIVKSLPYWFRFLQCIRRYYHIPNNTGLINSFKYVCSIIAGVLNIIQLRQRPNYDTVLSNPYTVSWLIMNVISSIYCCIYDIAVDWGLLEGFQTFLKSNLIYSPKALYYLAVVENVILRFDWIIFFYMTSVKVFEPIILAWLQNVLEIFRRCIWNFFRLENEHINNVGRYRAVRDISVQPLMTVKK